MKDTLTNRLKLIYHCLRYNHVPKESWYLVYDKDNVTRKVHYVECESCGYGKEGE